MPIFFAAWCLAVSVWMLLPLVAFAPRISGIITKADVFAIPENEKHSQIGPVY